MGATTGIISGRPAPERGTLYLSTPLQRTATALREALWRAGLPSVEVEPGVLATAFSACEIDFWNDVFCGALSQVEMEMTKCRLMPCGLKATSAELMQSQSVPDFLVSLEGQWLADLLRTRRLTSLFQPIVKIDRPDEIYAYECLLRGIEEDGSWIAPDRMFAAARGMGTLAELDQVALVTAVESAARHRLKTSVFVNVNLNVLVDSERFLATTVAATKASGIAASRFVFEVVESDEIMDPVALAEVLDAFRREGYRVALDDVGAGYASLNLLARVKPDFMKLDIGLIRNVDIDIYKGRVAAKLLELARDLGVKTVVEGVETAGEWEWSRDHRADYAQGYLFARPAAEPPVSEFAGVEEAVGNRG